MSGCQHLRSVPVPEPEAKTEGCEECLALGQEWVHLRKCLDCGHIGCCDASIGKHATKHFHQTGHACIRSAEPREHWAYCFIDEAME